MSLKYTQAFSSMRILVVCLGTHIHKRYMTVTLQNVNNDSICCNKTIILRNNRIKYVEYVCILYKNTNTHMHVCIRVYGTHMYDAHSYHTFWLHACLRKTHVHVWWNSVHTYWNSGMLSILRRASPTRKIMTHIHIAKQTNTRLSFQHALKQAQHLSTCMCIIN